MNACVILAVDQALCLNFHINFLPCNNSREGNTGHGGAYMHLTYLI